MGNLCDAARNVEGPACVESQDQDLLKTFKFEDLEKEIDTDQVSKRFNQSDFIKSSEIIVIDGEPLLLSANAAPFLNNKTIDDMDESELNKFRKFIKSIRIPTSTDGS